MCLPHIRRHCIAVNIHGCANVGMTHELLLYAYRSSNRIEPTAVSVSEHVRTDVTDTCHSRGTVQSPPHVRVAVWLASELHRAGKHPIIRGRELGCLPPML